MNVQDLMSSPVITIRADASIEEAAQLIIEQSTSCLPVLGDNGELVGILTHTDFGFHRRFLPMANHLYTLMGSSVEPDTLEEVAKTVSSKKVRDVMSHPVITVQENTSVSEVAELMLNKNINRFPVMRGDDLVGIITRHDFIKLMTINPEPI